MVPYVFQIVLKPSVAWSVVSLEPGECDALGMHAANVMALRMALLRLEVAPTYVLTDGFAVDSLVVRDIHNLERDVAREKPDIAVVAVRAAGGQRPARAGER